MGAKFSALIQTCSEAHPASCTTDTGSLPGVKRSGRDVDHSPPPSAEVRERSRAIPLLSLKAFVAYKKSETYLYGVKCDDSFE